MMMKINKQNTQFKGKNAPNQNTEDCRGTNIKRKNGPFYEDNSGNY